MEFFSSKPALLAAFQDPSRIFNMDETSVQIGSSGHRVLAEKNTKVLYSISSGSRDHITASYMVSANGAMVPPRLVFKGVRNVALVHLKDLPKDGKSGEWQMSVSPKGFVTRELHLEILKDLDKYLVATKTARPVILYLDGASPHISLEAMQFCKEKNIQPWLFRPNMTHLLQPLDLTFFSSLKAELKSVVWNWHGEVANAGQTLNKYSVVVLRRLLLRSVWIRRVSSPMDSGGLAFFLGTPLLQMSASYCLELSLLTLQTFPPQITLPL